MTTRYLSLAAAVCAAVTLSACGGGGSNGGLPPAQPTTAPSTQPSSPPSSNPTAIFVINVPSATSTTSTKKRPQFDSPNTRSVRIALQSANGQPNTSISTTAQIGSGAPGCSSTSTGTACTVKVNGIAGTDVYTIATYQSTDGSGSPLATTAIGVAVSATSATPTQVSLGGVPAKLSFSPAKLPLVNDGARHRVPVTVNAADASGATIVGSTPYQSPVSLQVLNDPSHALTLSTTSISQPGTVVTVTYDSGKPLSNAQIVASYTGLQSATVTAAPLTVSQTQLALLDDGSNPSSVQVTEAGFTGTFTVSLANAGVATAVLLNGTTGSGNAVVKVAAVQGVRLNSTTLTVGDGNVSVTIPTSVVPKPGTYTAFGAQHLLLAPLGLVEGPDGRLWTSDGANGDIVAFNKATQAYQKYLVDPAEQGPNYFAFDSSGNVWYSDASQIGELNPATGVVTTYSTGLSAAPAVTAIIAGAPGSNTMWFYDQGVNSGAHNVNNPTYIGSINTTNGQITEYQTPNNALPLLFLGVPQSMVMGPDNGVWFADGGHFLIWRFDATTHQFTQYNPSTPNFPTQSPQALAVGPDGNIWFTSSWIDPPGPVTSLMGEIQLKNKDAVQTFNEGMVPSTFPTMILGSDKNLWFAENVGANLDFTTFGAINPSTVTSTGTVAYHQYAQAITPEHAFITNLVDGGDGKTLWTLDTNNGQIGEVTFK